MDICEYRSIWWDYKNVKKVNEFDEIYKTSDIDMRIGSTANAEMIDPRSRILLQYSMTGLLSILNRNNHS